MLIFNSLTLNIKVPTVKGLTVGLRGFFPVIVLFR